MNDAQRAELQALLTRAAVLEAARQTANAAGDARHVDRIEQELRRLWSRYSELEAA